MSGPSSVCRTSFQRRLASVAQEPRPWLNHGCWKAAILVPFPAATDNHQQRNAEALANAEAAEMILQRDLTGKTGCPD
jgi:hypothetical protein